MAQKDEGSSWLDIIVCQKKQESAATLLTKEHLLDIRTEEVLLGRTWAARTQRRKKLK